MPNSISAKEKVYNHLDKPECVSAQNQAVRDQDEPVDQNGNSKKCSHFSLNERIPILLLLHGSDRQRELTEKPWRPKQPSGSESH
jgi:hypothetical protein